MAVDNAAMDGVAIIGMAGRFPGAENIADFWRNLIEGRDSITHFDPEQLSPSLPSELKSHPRYVAARGVIAHADRFDAAFFGIGPREALLIDPQQRVFLELCWNALEHAGIDPKRYPGSIGVYAGVSNNGYRKLLDARPDLVAESGEFALMLANEKDYLATRVAHRIGLNGPAISLYTACSTSLVAIAQAWYALMSWQCDAALAGGINISLPQEAGYLPVDGGMESPDGRCRPFAADAGGTVFSSGGGVVVLKRLADAIAAGDQIWGVIRGVGVNNDGGDKASFTAPSANGQAEAIRLALSSADVAADSISYVEAHGTGTALGDPIEVDGLTRAFREQTNANGFCWLGSVKSNIGHLVAGSGVAGLIKTVLALHHEQIPASLHFQHANPEIDFEATPFKVAAAPVAWPRGARPRRAGISSFGVGGTNAHLILEEPPVREPAARLQRAFVALPLSARDEPALLRRAAELAGAMADCRDQDLADIGWSLATGRRELRMRAAVAASSIAQAQQRLPEVGATTAREHACVVFLFPGQGSQHPGMARGLLHEPVFAQAFDRVCALASELLGNDLRALILTPSIDADEEREHQLAETRHAQPALFAVEYALACLWRSWGVQPHAMLGHSIGEYVAACIAEVFTLEDAVRLVVARAEAMQAQPAGAMLAIRAEETELATRLPRSVEIAAVNAPGSVVVAGAEADIDEFAHQLGADRIASTRLHVSHAFHSPLMDPALPLFRRAFASVRLKAPTMPFYSCVTGLPVSAVDATSPDYWCRQIRAPVRFADAVAHALADPACIALEVGPGQALSATLRRTPGLRERVVASLGAARDPGADEEHLAVALGQLWCLGAAVDWNLYFGEGRQRVALPGYPFEGPRYWVDAPAAVHAPQSPPASAPEAAPSTQLPDADGAYAGAQAEQSSDGDRLRAELRSLAATLSGEALTVADDGTRFLDLGLDSLALTQAALEIENRYGLKLRLRRLMEDVDTIAKLAALVAESGHSAVRCKSGTAAAASGARAERDAASPARSVASGVQARVSGESPLPNPSSPFGAAARITVKPDASLDVRQQNWLARFTERYVARTGASKAFSQHHRASMADPRVVTGFNPLWKELVYPIVVQRSSGAQLWDLDGNRYIDLLNAFGANFLGYQPEFIKRALTEQIESGFEIGPQHPLTAEVTALIRQMTGVDRVAFCNTGSEAVMGAMRIARTVTGRKTIVIFKDSYHGIFDEVIVRGTPQLRSIAAAPGILANAVENILVLDYGSDAALEAIRARAGELAAVMIEPIQARNPELQPRSFVHALRGLCEANGCALIFDEVITGFRIGKGGAQEFYGVRADLVTYGKIIGGGLPLAAIGGSARWMNALDGGPWQFGDDSRPEAGVTYFAGTFVRHPLALAASKAALLHLRERGPALQQALNVRTRDLVDRLNGFFRAQSAPLRAVAFSSLWRIRVDADQALSDLFYFALRERGLHLYAQFNCFLTDAHGEAEVDEVIAAIKAATLELLDAGVLVRKRGATQPVLQEQRPSALLRAEGLISTVRQDSAAANVLPFDDSGLPVEVPLTDAQTEKWLACQFGDSANIAFNESQLLQLHGELDTHMLELAIEQVSARHEAFAMSFAADGSVLRIAALQPLAGTYVDLQQEGKALEEHCESVVRRPFDLTRAPLARIELIRIGATHHALLVVAHHLVFDGWSAAVFFEELASGYKALRAGQAPDWPPPQSFRAFALEERARRTGAAAQIQLNYWTALYGRAPDALQLPTDRPHPLLPNFAASTLFHDFSPELTTQLRQFSRSNGITLYGTLLAAFSVLLARLSDQFEFAIGIPFASQAPAGRDAMIGDGVNTLPLRLALHPDETFSALARRCQRSLLDAADNQDVTLYTILSALGHRQRAERGALTDVIFNLNPRVPRLDFGGIAYTLRDCAKAALVRHLFFNLNDLGSQLTLDVHYRTALFDAGTVARWIDHFDTLLTAVTQAAERPVAMLPVLSAQQRDAIMRECNSTARAFELSRSLPALVADQAWRSPDRVAVECGGTTLTYAELWRSAQAIARSLRDRGIGQGDVVGICVPRGVRMLAGLLGILASGAAYLPLDAAYPEERLGFVIADAGLRHMLVATRDRLPPVLGDSCVLHRYDELVSHTGEAALPEVDGETPAYVLYTSGSTGTPKGVRVLHRNLSNFLLSMRERPGLEADDVLCAVTTLSFDIAALELYLPLLVGARVVIASDHEHRDPDALIALMRTHAATVLQTTPSWLRILASGARAAHLPMLKLLIGGEELPRDLAESVLPRCVELWNLYGPTETTVWSALSRVASGQGNVPIGRPIANTRVYILDSRQQLAPLGVRGEIWIAGAGVAAGYLNQPALTADRFRADPFVPGERMYRTGDIGSWSEGQLCFHGRIDNQIKLRGFRIEPGDIEAAALAETGVCAAVASVFPVTRDDRRLVLYVIAPDAPEDFASELRNRLRQRLPPHMIPQHIERLDEFPQTAHGKIDRQALPAPAALAEPSVRTDSRARPLDDALTHGLVEIWSELLGTTQVSLDANFFDLGGDSLLGVELFQRAHALTGVNLPLATLLTAQTIREQVRVFRDAGAREPSRKRQLPAPASGANAWSPLVTIQGAGALPPLFAVHALGGNVLNYVPLARALGSDQPVFGLQAIGLDGITPPLVTVEAMAARYLDDIRAQVPHGPYYLCGGSMGGLIAFELAQLLVAQGEQIAFLGLFDTYGPGSGSVDADHGGALDRSIARWRDRWKRARVLAPEARRLLLAAALRRRAHRLSDALSAAWHHWRGTALPHGVRYRELERIHLRADDAYRPRAYPGVVTLFRAKQQPEQLADSRALGWEAVTLGGIEVIDVPGTHDTLIEQPELASELRRALHQAREHERQGLNSGQRRAG